MKKRLLHLLLILSALLLLAPYSYAITGAVPKIAIIIDDLGDSKNTGLRVIHLPGPVVCSIMPHTFYSTILADAAHQAGKEVMLHAPMQALKPHELGHGGLYADMTATEFLTTLNEDLRAVPHIQGINNHMGSRLTMQREPMNWLMQTLKMHGFYFIDSKTSPRSVAEKIAQEQGVPTLHRDIFLDDIRTPTAIRQQFNELLALARHHGSAIAIGHPHTVTLDFLEEVLPHLEAQGYQLVSLSQLLSPKSNQQLQLVPQSQIKKSPKLMCEVYPRVCEWITNQ